MDVNVRNIVIRILMNIKILKDILEQILDSNFFIVIKEMRTPTMLSLKLPY